MKKFNLKKFISLSVAAVFLFSSLTANANAAIPAAPAGNTLNNFNFSIIPMSQGKVTSLTDKHSDIVVINIQDLHAHSDTQRNISKIIDSMASKYNVSGIYTEGGFGKIDVSWINQIKDEKLKEKIIEQLVNSGDLTASEYYAMTVKDALPVKGIEDKKTHAENIKRLADIENNKAKYEEIIAKVNKEIDILNKLYTNGRNIRFNRTLEKYSEGKIADAKLYQILEKHVTAISENPSKYNNITKIKLDNYPNIKFYLTMIKEAQKTDDKRAAMELQALIGTLKNTISYNQYKQIIDDTNNFQDSEKLIEFVSAFLKANPEAASRYRNLNKLSAINDFTKVLNPVDLLSEQRILIEKIKFALAYNNTEAEISFITDFKKYFGDFLTASLTQDDWIYVKENLHFFTSIYAKYSAYNNLKAIEADFAELTKYYDINTRRNEIFLSHIFDKNVLTRVNEAKTDTPSSAAEILSNAKDVKIIIAGGYHSEGLKELLSEKGISSIVITPNVTTDISKAHARYKEMIIAQAKFPSEALAAILASNIPSANQTAMIIQAAINAGLNQSEIDDLIKNSNFEITINENNIIINGEDHQISKNNITEVKNISDVIKVLESLGDIFNNLDVKVLKQVGSLFFNMGLGEAGIIDKAETDAEYISGISRHEFDRYPAFIQKILYNRRIVSYDKMLDIINSAIKKDNTITEEWEKNPIFGYKIPEFKNRQEAIDFYYNQLPKNFVSMVGAMDQQWFASAESQESRTAKTFYGETSEEYKTARLLDELLEQKGSAIALQTMESGELDIYIIGKKDFLLEDGGPYEIVKKDYVDEHNSDLSGILKNKLGIDTSNGNNIVPLRKTTYEKLIPVSKLSDISLTVVNSNGNRQDIKSGSFLLIKKTDEKGNVTKFHIVNSDPSSLKPINYTEVEATPVDVVTVAGNQKNIADESELLDSYPPHATITQKILSGLILRADKIFKNKGMKLPVFTFIKKAPLFGYKIPAINTKKDAESFFNSLPKGISSSIGSVDNALYMSFLHDDFGKTDIENYKFIKDGKHVGYEELAVFSGKDEQWLRDSISGAKEFINSNDIYDEKTKNQFAKQYKELIDLGVLFQFFIDSGSVIALQTDAKDRPDFYIIGKIDYDTAYGGDAGNISINEVNTDNRSAANVSLQDALQKAFNIKKILDSQDMSAPVIVGLKKNITVTALRASDLGLNIQSETAAGVQTNLNGAFIVIDKKFNWYAVNAEDGELRPVQYKRPEAETIEQKVSKTLFGYDTETANKILNEIILNHNFTFPHYNSLSVDSMIAAPNAGLPGNITVNKGLDGSISMIFTPSKGKSDPGNKLAIAHSGLIEYGDNRDRISTIDDANKVSDYLKNLLAVMMKEGAYRLWKKGEYSPSVEDKKYFEQLESDAKAIYESKKARIEELSGLISNINPDSLEGNLRQKYDEARMFYNNAQKQLLEYYKEPSAPAFEELMTVKLSENDVHTKIDSLENHIKQLKTILIEKAQQQAKSITEQKTGKQFDKAKSDGVFGTIFLAEFEKLLIETGLSKEILEKTLKEVSAKTVHRTFIMIKPDGYAYEDEVLAELQSKGFKIVKQNEVTATRDLFKEHYEEHKGKPFLEGLISYMMGELNKREGENLHVYILEGTNAINAVREALGPTDFTKDVEKKTIRGKYATRDQNTGIIMNLVHASDLPSAVLKESGLWGVNAAEYLSDSSAIDLSKKSPSVGKVVKTIITGTLILIMLLSATACNITNNNDPASNPTSTEQTYKKQKMAFKDFSVDENGALTAIDENGNRVIYVAKGIAWNVPNDHNGNIFEFYEYYKKGLIENLNELGINSIRTYRLPIAYDGTTPDWEKTTEMLKAFKDAKISISIGMSDRDFGYNGLLREFIQKFDSKTNPENNLGVVAMYLIGNEFNYHFTDTAGGLPGKWFSRNEWLTYLEDGVGIVRSLSSTPVGTVHGEVPSEEDAQKYAELELDAVLLNVYRHGSDYSAIEQTKNIFARIGGKMPHIGFGEIGGDPNNTGLAESHADIIKNHPETSYYYFALMHKDEPEGTYGLLDNNGNKTPAFGVFQEVFSEIPDSLPYKSLTSDATLDKWYSKLLIKLFGEKGLRIVQVAIAPIAERNILKNIFDLWEINESKALSEKQKFFEEHSGYNESTAARYEAGFQKIMQSAGKAYMRFDSIKFLQNIAVNITLIISHAAWNAKNKDRALSTDTDEKMRRNETKKNIIDRLSKNLDVISLLIGNNNLLSLEEIIKSNLTDSEKEILGLNRSLPNSEEDFEMDFEKAMEALKILNEIKEALQKPGNVENIKKYWEQQKKEKSDKIKEYLKAMDKGRSENGGYQKGALVDLRKNGKEVIVVGDLHAKIDNLKNILETKDSFGVSNKEKIEKGDAVLVFLGDAVHDQNKEKAAQMHTSFEIMDLIMDLKIKSPKNVYYMLGNHDIEKDIVKHVPQAMFYDMFLKALFDESTINDYFNALYQNGLVALGDNFIAAHAGPIVKEKKTEKMMDYEIAEFLQGLDHNDPIFMQIVKNIKMEGDFEGALQSSELIKEYVNVHVVKKLSDEKNRKIIDKIKKLNPVYQLIWNRYSGDAELAYTGEDVNAFLKAFNMDPDNAALIVGHSPGNIDNGGWHKEVFPNHHIVVAEREKFGFLRILSEGKKEFIEVDKNNEQIVIENEVKADVKENNKQLAAQSGNKSNLIDLVLNDQSVVAFIVDEMYFEAVDHIMDKNYLPHMSKNEIEKFVKEELRNSKEVQDSLKFLDWVAGKDRKGGEGKKYYISEEESTNDNGPEKYFGFFNDIEKMQEEIGNKHVQFEVLNRFHFINRDIVEIKYSNGQRFLFYRSAYGTGSKDQGIWYPFGGITGSEGFLGNHPKYWLIKRSGIENFYDLPVLKETSEKLAEQESKTTEKNANKQVETATVKPDNTKALLDAVEKLNEGHSNLGYNPAMSIFVSIIKDILSYYSDDENKNQTNLENFRKQHEIEVKHNLAKDTDFNDRLSLLQEVKQKLDKMGIDLQSLYNAYSHIDGKRINYGNELYRGKTPAEQHVLAQEMAVQVIDDVYKDFNKQGQTILNIAQFIVSLEGYYDTNALIAVLEKDLENKNINAKSIITMEQLNKLGIDAKVLLDYLYQKRLTETGVFNEKDAALEARGREIISNYYKNHPALTSDTTLTKWYSRLLIKLFGEKGLRIVQVAIAPIVERSILKNIFDLWEIDESKALSEKQKFFEEHSGYNESTAAHYEAGFKRIMQSAGKAYMRFDSIKFLQNIAVNIALIISHAKWNKDYAHIALTTDKKQEQSAKLPYDIISETTDYLQTELDNIKDVYYGFLYTHYSDAENEKNEERRVALREQLRIAFFRDTKAKISEKYYDTLAFIWNFQQTVGKNWLGEWLLKDNAADFFNRLDTIEKNIKVKDVFSKTPKVLLYISRFGNIDIKKINNKYIELFLDLEQHADVFLGFGKYADNDILEKLYTFKQKNIKITQTVFTLALLGFDYEQITKMGYRSIDEKSPDGTINSKDSIIIFNSLSKEKPINAILGDVFVSGRFLPIDTDKKLMDFSRLDNGRVDENVMKKVRNNSLAVMDFYSFVDSRMNKDFFDGRTLDGSMLLGIEKFEGREKNLVYSPGNFWPEYFNMFNWHAFEEEFGYDPLKWSLPYYQEEFPKVIDKIEKRDMAKYGYVRPFVFFLPSKKLKYEKNAYGYSDSFTGIEFRYFLEHPEKMKNVIFVVGAYDFFDIDSSLVSVFDGLGMSFLFELLQDYKKYIDYSYNDSAISSDKSAESQSAKGFNEMLNEFKATLALTSEMNDISVRKADTRKDFNAAYSLLRNQFGGYVFESIRNGTNMRNNYKGNVWVAEKDGVVISAMLFKDNELRFFATDSQHRGKGVGGIFLDKVREEFKKEDKNLHFHTNEDRVAFYQRHGYEVTQTVVQDGRSRYYMADADTFGALDLSESDMVDTAVSDQTIENTIKAAINEVNKLVVGKQISEQQAVKFLEFINVYFNINAVTPATAIFMEDSEKANTLKNIELAGDTALILINTKKSEGTPTGLKVDGKQIYMQKTGKHVVFSAQGIKTEDIINTLQASAILSKAVKAVTQLKGENVSVDSIVVDTINKTGKEFNGDMIKVGYEDFQNAVKSDINEYTASLREEKRLGRAAQAELQLISLVNSDEKRVENVIKDIVNQNEISAKRIVVEDNGYAYNTLQDLLKNNNKTMSDLHNLGIEVYIAGSRSNAEYAKEGFSGIIKGDALYDRYTGEFIKIRQAKNAEDLKIRFDGYTMIELDTLIGIFDNARNKMGNAFEWLSGFFNISLDGIGINEAIRRAYNMNLANLPEATRIIDAEEAIKKMSLPILTNLNLNITDEAREAYKNAVIEMILAASFIKNKKGFVLKDEKMIRTLGKMLVLREKLAAKASDTEISKIEDTIDKFQSLLGQNSLKTEDIIRFTELNELTGLTEEDLKGIDAAKAKEKKDNVNTVIEMIDIYGFAAIKDLKDKKDPTKEYTMSGMRAILTAA
ncbi:MAG: GNAT family N-acetyltransferase [Endomicrobia bacterium]|nr:GNAT family N-acetyltransferase [Endomicrobiia bacterium]MCL2506673.1 GNAT family N-acetyltransferase [Endomicrobiia bacterium]